MDTATQMRMKGGARRIIALILFWLILPPAGRAQEEGESAVRLTGSGDFPLSGSCPSPEFACQDPADQQQAPGVPAAVPEAPQYRRFGHILVRNLTRGLFSTENLLPIAIGSTSSAAFLPVDREISDAFRGHWDELGDAGHWIASPIAVAGLTGGFVLAAQFTDNRRFRGYAFTLAQGIIVSNALVFPLKYAVRRERPDGQNETSFPSGHAASSMALAVVSAHYYGRKIGIPLYLLAGLVAASRIEKGKHFPSDVIFGATLGYISARTAIRTTEDRGYASKQRGGIARRHWMVTPALAVRSTGLTVQWSF